MTDYRRVRSGSTCPHCFGPKDFHLLLCWPCHHAVKVNGMYPPEVEQEIQEMEDFWAEMEASHEERC